MSFIYRAQSWKRPRRVVAKVEWHEGELYPRVGFIVTVRLQLHALAYNLANFMRTLAMPDGQMAEVAVLRQLFADILRLIARLRALPAPA